MRTGQDQGAGGARNRWSSPIGEFSEVCRENSRGSRQRGEYLLDALREIRKHPTASHTGKRRRGETILRPRDRVTRVDFQRLFSYGFTVLATRMGFEPTISALTGRCVKPGYTTGPRCTVIPPGVVVPPVGPGACLGGRSGA